MPSENPDSCTLILWQVPPNLRETEAGMGVQGNSEKDALAPKPHAPARSQILAGSLERLRNNRRELHRKTRTHEPAQRPLSGPRREIAEPKDSHRDARPKLRLARPDFLVLLLANFISGSVSAVPYRPGAGIGRTSVTGSGARPAARPAIGRKHQRNGCRCIRSRRSRSSHCSRPRRPTLEPASALRRRWAILLCRRRTRAFPAHDCGHGLRGPDLFWNPASGGAQRCPADYARARARCHGRAGRRPANRSGGRSDQGSGKTARPRPRAKLLCQLHSRCCSSRPEAKVRACMENDAGPLHFRADRSRCGSRAGEKCVQRIWPGRAGLCQALRRRLRGQCHRPLHRRCPAAVAPEAGSALLLQRDLLPDTE